MSDFTSAFLDKFIENLVMGIGGSLNPSHTTVTSTTAGLATSTSNIGTQLMDSDNEMVSTTGCMVTSTGTSVSLSGSQAYEQTIKQMEMTQAYVESLDEQQMLELMTKLDRKESELEEVESSKQKVKHL